MPEKTGDVSGVYVIKCLPTGQSYIGSSLRIYNRWYQHRLLLRTGHHHARQLQEAWALYGEDAFAFAVLEECASGSTKDYLLSREQEYLDAFRPALNHNPKAASRLGSRDRSETRLKKSLVQRARLAVRTQCPQGHPYNEGNTYLDPDGGRRCRQCQYEANRQRFLNETAAQRQQRRDRQRRYYEQRKETLLARAREYAAEHKAQKREYDRQRRARRRPDAC